MSIFLDNLAVTLMIAGVVLLITEILIIGFSTLVLFFLGLSFIITGISMEFGLLPETLKTSLWSNVILTGLFAAVFWKPLKNLQKTNKDARAPVNTFDHQFVLDDDVDVQGKVEHQYSGVTWKLKSQKPIEKGIYVTVVKTEVGVLWVEKVQNQ